MIVDTEKQSRDVKECVETLLRNVEEEEVIEFYSVAFDRAGNASLYYAGNWQRLGTSSAFLQSEFSKLVNGCYDE